MVDIDLEYKDNMYSDVYVVNIIYAIAIIVVFVVDYFKPFL